MLWRGPEPLHVQPPAQTFISQAEAHVPSTAASAEGSDHLVPQAEAAAKTKAAKAQLAASPGVDTAGNSNFTSPTDSDVGRPNTLAAAAGKAAASPQPLPFNTARVAGRKFFQEHFKRRRRRGGAQLVIKFIAWLTAAAAALAVLSDVSLRRFPEHRCNSLLRCACDKGSAFRVPSALPDTFRCGLQSVALPACTQATHAVKLYHGLMSADCCLNYTHRFLPGGAAGCLVGGHAAHGQVAAQHWASEVYGFILTVHLLCGPAPTSH